MDIKSHQIWKGVKSYKKPIHLARMFVARRYAKLFPKTTFIGITGTVGKTTTAIACTLVLSTKYPTISTTETNSKTVNLDPIFNIPLTLLRLRRKVKKVILEMGIEYPGDMDFYLTLVQPQKAIMTRVAFQHAEFLGGIDDVLKEKGKLIEQLPEKGLAILNYDDVNVRSLMDKTAADVMFYGLNKDECHIWASNIKIKDFKTVFEINYGVERVEVKSNLLGEHQVYAALAAAALGVSEGISLVAVKNALEKMYPTEHRMQVLPGQNGAIIIDDTYNSAPVSVEMALDTLQQLPARRRILVLGETKELGKFSEQEHRRIAQRIFKDRIDLVFLGTGDTKYVSDELEKLGFLTEKVEADLQNPQLVARLLTTLGKGDICLVKGSRGVRLDEVVDRIIIHDHRKNV